MSGLNMPTDGTTSDTFPTIADVGLDAISNRVAPRQVASGTTRGIQQLGSDKVYSDGGNQQIIVADSTPRVLMGNQASFGEGFYVSKSGVDATTNTDAAQWIFNSNQNIFKIVNGTSGSTTSIPAFSLAAGQLRMNTITIPHGLSFVPILDASAQVTYFVSTDGSNSNINPITVYTQLNYNGADGLLDSNIVSYKILGGVDALNIYFSYIYQTTTGGSGGIGYNFPATPIRYYLLQQTAN